MTETEIESLIDHSPFQPYRFVLDDGEEVLVRRPRKASVSGGQLAAVGICRKAGANGGVEKLRLIRIDRIVSAEHVEG